MLIYLYIKKCSHCDLKYFGKTGKDPYKYKGSGKYWLRHIKQHGSVPETIEIRTFFNQEDASIFAVDFSEKNDIVKSNNWANLIIENAIDGGPPGANVGRKHSEKINKSKGRPGIKRPNHGDKIRNAIFSGKMNHIYIGYPHSEETKIKLRKPKSDKTNYQGRKWYHSKSLNVEACVNHTPRWPDVSIGRLAK